MKMAIVYKITNTLNNKSYVGMTIYSLEHRWKRHLSAAKGGSKFRFHGAIRKYGPDPWKFQILLESDDLDIIRKFEEHIIVTENLISKLGYNAKPGGCGGWIVPNDKVEQWKQKQSIASSGLTNPNAGTTTNEKMIELCLELSLKLGFIPSFPKFRKYSEENGFYIPINFTKFRFNGSYKNLVSIVSEETGLIHQPYFRDEDYKKNARTAQLKYNENRRSLKNANN
jgi:group I intron endonuclease